MNHGWTTCILGLLACAACGPAPESTALNLTDVSGGDCAGSSLVFDKPPSQVTPTDLGIAFINDGCDGARIRLGIHGSRRELRRRDDGSPLGTGGPYSDGEFRVLVTQGRDVSREVVPCAPGAPCDPLEGAAYEARVRIWSSSGSWTIDGTLLPGSI